MVSTMSVSSATLHRRVKFGDIQPHTNAIKPKLTEANKLARLKYCLSMISRSPDGGMPKFHDMMNYIHIDELEMVLHVKGDITLLQTSFQMKIPPALLQK